MEFHRNVQSLKTEAVDGHEREKDYLDELEIDRLLSAAKKGRNGLRNHLLLLMMFQHGLRVSEAADMRLSHLLENRNRLWVKRKKGSLSTEHVIEPHERRALNRYLKTRDDDLPWVFISERNGPLHRRAIYAIVRQAGERAGLNGVYPHMLRHSCGHYLARQNTNFRVIQDFLGHRNPMHTAHYTRTSSRQFENLFDDCKITKW